MRIRTTRQAREIRQGIRLGRNPLLVYIHRPFLEAFPLMRNAYYRTKNQPPAGVDRHERTDHPGRHASNESGWEIGDEIVCIPAGDGWVYINKKAAERMGIDLITKINKREDRP